MKLFIKILFFIGVLQYTIAQDTIISSPDEIRNGKEFRFSIFIGWPVGTAKTDIEDAMIASGFDDNSPASWFGSGSYHPYTNNYPIFDIELTYFLDENNGISLNVGISDNIEVYGYNEEASFLFIKSELWSGSLNYAYRSKNNRHTGYIGPTLIFHNAKRTSSQSNNDFNAYDATKFGLYTGYTFNFLQKRVFFLAFKLNVRWAGKTNIGPYYAGYGDRLAEFPETSVSLTTLNIGLSIGFRNGKK